MRELRAVEFKMEKAIVAYLLRCLPSFVTVQTASQKRPFYVRVLNETNDVQS